jgi:hypothetical protein
VAIGCVTSFGEKHTTEFIPCKIFGDGDFNGYFNLDDEVGGSIPSRSTK